ncbi:type II toxin-antitoxin system RelE/ParE family toxin [uncultured Holdemanella sp.]|uniref:type II toxin-antitoxin system RelE/ParE family toxin n=1 Tax=uncultured Holdemanella sp. TaxID=1763549 RepID=UPI0026583151|nr:type II toxin-antitoxin system RelE/ParE family toxin [uncultured Holdemanella sp.]
MYEIILYDTEDGRCLVQELLDSLEPKLLAKTLRTIDLLEMNGPLLREPYSKPLENGIFELRTKQGSDITRVLYFFIVGKKAVLTNGFIKKSQKTPKAEQNWQRSIKQIMNGGMAMSSYKDYKKRALQNSEVKAEYDALQPEYDIIQAMIDARVQQNMTQKDLSTKTGITQADISRIENGTRNPSLSMVKKLAHGLGMQLKLEFVPMPTKNKM